jgi:hypothetical protein
VAALCLHWRQSRTPNANNLKMLTTFKSLPSASELPIIVAMKMWIGIGAQQDGEQSPQQHCSVNPPLSWSPRGPVSGYMPPTQNPTGQPPRRGTACCARCCVADQRRSLATTVRYQPLRLCSDLNPPAHAHLLHPKNASKLRNTPTFLPGSGTKVEAIENTRLNPVYPVLELHNVMRANRRVPSASH